METLYVELTQLGKHYGKQLKEESVQSEVECLTAWIEAYRNGSREAAEYLEEYGILLLENIRSRLKEAAVGLQRMDGESPANSGAAADNAHHMNHATNLVLHAEEEMEAAINEEIHSRH